MPSKETNENKDHKPETRIESILQKKELIEILRLEVEQNFGRKVISSRDCIQLSDDIASKVSYLISSNTLRRFFNLIKSEYPVSTSTVNMLVKYCGFDSIEELLETRKQSEKRSTLNDNGILNYIVALFKATDVKSPTDETYLSLVRQTIDFMQKNESLVYRFQKLIAKTKNGQQFYFEKFVNIDKLNSYYGEGLRYYLQERTDTNSQIFGHSLLAITAWFSKDNEAFEKHLNEVKNRKLQEPCPVIILTRYYITLLLEGEMHNKDVSKIISRLYECHEKIIARKDNFKSFPFFEYAMSFMLILTGHPNESLYYSEYALKNYKEMQESDKSLCRSIELFKAFSLLKQGNKKESEKIFNKLRPSGFYFLSRKTVTIIYLVLSKYLNKNTPKTDIQLNELISETGYIRLKEL